MTLKTRPVRLSLLSLLSAPLAGAKVNAQLSLSTPDGVVLPSYEIDGADVVPLVVTLTEDPAKPGDYIGDFWPNTRGIKGTRWLINIAAGELLMKSLNLTVVDGSASVVTPVSVMVNAPPYPQVFPAAQLVSVAQGYADAAGHSATLAAEAAQAAIDLGLDLGDVAAAAGYAQAAGIEGVAAAASAVLAANANTLAEAARDGSLVAGQKYATEALGRAAVGDGINFMVQGADDIACYEYRRTNSTTSVLIATYKSQAGVDNIALGFVWVKNGTTSQATLSNALSTTTRRQMYNAFKSLKLFGFDSTKPLRLQFVWNYVLSGGLNMFRLVFQEWSGSAWVTSFDSLNIDMVAAGYANNSVITYNATISGKTVIAVIDMSPLPVNVIATLNASTTLAGPELLVSPACFKSVETPFFAASIATSPITMTAMETTEVSHVNQYFGNIWSRYKADISTLNNLYATGHKRKLKYQAVKRLELYGFDSTKPLMLNLFWVDAYNSAGHHYYRFSFQEWSGSAWSTVFDTGNFEKSALGIVDGQVFTWDITLGAKRVIVDIDFANLMVNDNGALNSATPEFIVSKGCYKGTITTSSPIADQIQVFNGTKQYFKSKRMATITFQFDVFNATNALIYAVFKEFGWVPNFAVVGNIITSSNQQELQTYYLNGCSILAHTLTHPAMIDIAPTAGALTYDQAEAEIAGGKSAIEALGIKVSGFVTPASSMNIGFLPLMYKYFGYAFTGLNAGYWDQTVDPVKLSRYGLEVAMSGHNIAGTKAFIDNAIANNQLLVCYGHALPSIYLNGDGTPYMTEADLREILTYVKTKSDAGLCQVLASDEALYQYYKTPYV